GGDRISGKTTDKIPGGRRRPYKRFESERGQTIRPSASEAWLHHEFVTTDKYNIDYRVHRCYIRPILAREGRLRRRSEAERGVASRNRGATAIGRPQDPNGWPCGRPREGAAWSEALSDT